MAGELLLELLSEEIPARMQRDGLKELQQRLSDFLADAYLAPEVPPVGYVTPRRLTVIARGIPQQQDASDKAPTERRGPRIGAPDGAVIGFCRSLGLAREDLQERDGYYFGKLEQPGSPALEVLPKVITDAIEETVWPKSMRFPAAPLQWVRPINSIVCLFDGEIVPLSVGRVPVGRVTRGHRFLSPNQISVNNADEYLVRLNAAKVILDWSERRKSIDKDLKHLAGAEGLVVKTDENLLDEVTGLVEFPVVLMGAIEDASMELPPEVLATAMRIHQKYFTCLKPDGSPAPRFLFVANNLTPDDGKTIIAGNERVLRARLADARFFWDQDRKVRLEDRVEALKVRIYFEGLGSLYDKVKRVERLAGVLANEIATAAKATLPNAQGGGAASIAGQLNALRAANELDRITVRAAQLIKADLSSGTVGEFPELQGVMGRYYALNDNEDQRVADAIADHYKPLGPSDICPTAPISVVVAIADKIDNLVGFFAINEKPTGSRDPFALRRAALGIIRLILENNVRLHLRQAFSASYTEWMRDVLVGALSDHAPYPKLKLVAEDPTPDLLAFIADRLKVHLREQGVRHDLITAVFALNEDDLVRLLARVEALSSFLGTEDGTNLLIAYRRASNIVGIEEKRDRQSYDKAADAALFRPEEERTLYLALAGASSRLDALLEQEQFGRAMAVLAVLRRPVDEFFEKVTVNVSEPELRENRLRLLSQIRATMNRVADFSQIEG